MGSLELLSKVEMCWKMCMREVNRYNSATGHHIHFMFGFRVGFSGWPIEYIYFRCNQIQVAAAHYLGKFRINIIFRMAYPVHFLEIDSSKKCAKICHNLKYLLGVHKLRLTFRASATSDLRIERMYSTVLQPYHQKHGRRRKNAKSEVLASHSMHIMAFCILHAYNGINRMHIMGCI